MLLRRCSRFGPFASSAGALLVSACGGGGSGSETGRNGFVLTEVQYGRLVDDTSTTRLVSPLTTASFEPTDGRLVAG